VSTIEYKREGQTIFVRPNADGLVEITAGELDNLLRSLGWVVA
jgi:hypothetical protein